VIDGTWVRAKIVGHGLRLWSKAWTMSPFLLNLATLGDFWTLSIHEHCLRSTAD